jgi:glyoxylase-like metal-dependent hydrolase (beta-lactamase superfamily II)
MKRRDILKLSVFTGLLSLVPSTNLLAQTKKNENINDNKGGGFKKLKLGVIDFYILTDGSIVDESKTFCPRADLKALKQILADNFRPTETLDMALNVPLLKFDDKLILLDTGLGLFVEGFAPGKTGFLQESLRVAGFAPADVTDILISHAHPDHIGGVVNSSYELAFPNANIFIAKKEYDFWQQATLADFKNSALKNQPEFLNSYIPELQKIFGIIKPKLKFYDLGKPLYGIFNFQLAPGHTPGMVLTNIQSNGESLLYVADLIHSDVILFPHPDWGFSGDTDLDMAIASRIKVLKQLVASKQRTHGYHLPWPGFGYVKGGQKNSFTWVQQSFVLP